MFQTLLRIHYDLKQQQLQGEIDVPCTHFLETGSSLLHEMPWVMQKDYQVGKWAWLALNGRRMYM